MITEFKPRSTEEAAGEREFAPRDMDDLKPRGGEPPAGGNGKKPPPKLMTVADFAKGFVAPEFLVDGIVQRGYCYSLAAPTGTGKTAVALGLGFAVATGRPFGRARTERGRVAFFAGENPDDVRGRVLAQADAMGVSLADVDMHLTDERFTIANAAELVGEQIARLGGVDLVIVDTAAAFFGGDDENNNPQMQRYAGELRALTELPGHPAVIIPCHPIKNPTKDNCLPRGGGAFVAELDGNLRLWSDDDGETCELHWCGKLRGPGFEPMAFSIPRHACDAVRDAMGRQIPMPVAKPLAEADMHQHAVSTRDNDDGLLEAILANPTGSMAAWARHLGWFGDNGDPLKSRVQRCLHRLMTDKLVRRYRGKYVLTDAGKKEAGRALGA